MRTEPILNPSTGVANFSRVRRLIVDADPSTGFLLVCIENHIRSGALVTLSGSGIDALDAFIASLVVDNYNDNSLRFDADVSAIFVGGEDVEFGFGGGVIVFQNEGESGVQESVVVKAPRAFHIIPNGDNVDVYVRGDSLTFGWEKVTPSPLTAATFYEFTNPPAIAMVQSDSTHARAAAQFDTLA